MFAAGRLDEATAVLLGTMAPVAAGARVLDYGCGAGVIGAAIRQRAPDARLHLLDADAVAVAAARENVPGAAVYVSDGFGATPGRLIVDRIVSNPPIHRGKREDYSALVALIEEAPRHLARGGALELVVQRRLTVKPWIDAVFARVEPLFLDGRWQVWRASAPRAESMAAR
ncbi:MAG: methyltransferase [Myxococcales bacterium]|nr:methyltransferase [Myxococcales bacterium]